MEIVLTFCGDCHTYLNACFHILGQNGFKKTKNREKIAIAITEFEKAFTPKDIYERVSQSSAVDFATVYRNFQTFAECGLIHPVGTQGKFVACSEVHCDAKASHIIVRCKKCDDTQEQVTSGIGQFPQLKRGSFNIESSVTELVGFCNKCL